jgi:hypothetical protein
MPKEINIILCNSVYSLIHRLNVVCLLLYGDKGRNKPHQTIINISASLLFCKYHYLPFKMRGIFLSHLSGC